MRRRKLDSIGDITDAVIRRADPKKRRYAARVALVWEQIAGPEVAQHTVAASVREGEFVVSVDSAAWAHQLDLMKDRYLASIRSEIGEGVVKTIRFTVSKQVERSRSIEHEAAKVSEFYQQEATPSIPLSESERLQAEYIADAVKDNHLREAALRVMIKDLEWKKGVRANSEPHAPSDGATGDNSSL
ncbi:MAG: DUF721 domain-containing protein [Actinobacteria bacterium]|nr:MAG: DUF721 domain-containing protein [Actinomycetota bacterium]